MPAESLRGGLAPHELRRSEYLVSTDRSLVDLAVLHGFLTRSYWSPGISADRRRALHRALPPLRPVPRRAAGGLRARGHRLRQDRLRRRRVRAGGGARRGAGEAAGGGGPLAPGAAGRVALAAGDAGRARPLPPVRLHGAGPPGALHGASRRRKWVRSTLAGT